MKSGKPNYVELEKELLRLKEENEILKTSMKPGVIEERYKAMIANIGDVIGIVNKEGIIKYQSSNVEKRFGWNPKDLIGMNAWKTVHNEDTVRVKYEFFKLLKTENTSKTVEYRYKRKDGRYTWIELTAVNCLKDPVINGVLFNYHDISVRKQVEIELQKREWSLAKAQQAAKVGHYEWDLIVNEAVWSDEMFRIFEYDKKLGTPSPDDFLKFVHPEDKQMWEPENVTRLINMKSHELEFRIITKPNGGIKYIHLWGETFFDENKQPTKILGIFQDITEQKLAEAELRKREKEYRTTLDGLLVGVVVHATDTRILLCNPEASNILGLTPEQMLGKEAMDPFWHFVNEDLSVMKIEDYPVSKVISTKKPLTNYFVGIKRSDREFITWVNVNAMPMLLNDKIEKIVTNFVDITVMKQAEMDLQKAHNLLESKVKERTNQLSQEIEERKLTEKILLESRANMTAIIENTTDSIWAINPSYEILYANEVFVSGFYDSFGVKLEPGTNLLKSLPKPLKEVWKSRYDRVLKNERFTLIDKIDLEKSVVYVEVFMNPIIIEEKVVGASFFARDISARKKIEKELIESKARYQSILETSTEWIWKIDLSGKYVYSNNMVVEMLGYSIEEFFGNKYLSYLHEDDVQKVKESLLKLSKRKQGWSGRVLRWRHKNGSYRYFESNAKPIINVDGKIVGFSGADRDVTERIKIEKVIKENELKLRELNTTKDKLFSIIAHDLRGPFSAILSITDLLGKEPDSFNVEQSNQLIGYINSSAKQALTLLENLLSWAKMQTGQISFKPNVFTLQPIVQDIIDVLDIVSKSKRIKLSNNVSDDIEIYADLNMITTVLRNLIANAVKFTNKNGWVEITAKSVKEGIEVIVSDNGVGMNKQIQDKLFEMDAHHTARGTDNEKGSGLGLLLCKEFIEKHGGKIWAKSEEGKGSKFRFTLPFKS